MGPIDRARAEGYTEEEIQAHLAPKIAAAQAEGYSPEEIGKHLGIKPIDHGAATNAMAGRVQREITTAQEGAKKRTALEEMGQTVKDTATVYAPIEGALHLATGIAGGFPAYLAGGIGGLIARHTYSPETDPKEIATKFAEAMTYKPRTDAGERFTSALTYPLRTLMEWSESAGKKVADKTDSAAAAGITEATIQMLPAFLIPAFGRMTHGKNPTNSDFHTNAREVVEARTPQTVPVEGAEAAAQAARDPAIIKDLATRSQEVYEKTGIDPQTLKQEALQDATVLPDLVSSNLEVPRALGGKPPAPPEPPAPIPPEMGDPQKAVLARISVGEQKVRDFTWDKFYTAVKDDLYPLAKIEKELVGGKALEVAESPYKLARLVRGAAGKATQFLDHSTFDFNTYKNTGAGLKQILEPHKNDLDGFRAYAVARRTEELNARGIETGVPLAEAVEVVMGGKQYKAAFEELQSYQNSLAKYLKDAGLVSEKGYAAMLEANKDYVPFHRVVEGESLAGAGSGLKTRNPIKAIKGSERKIVDPLESIIKNTYLYTALAERNAVGRAFGELIAASPEAAKDLGISTVRTKVKPIEVTEVELAAHGIEAEAFTIFRPNAMQPAPNQIRYFENGKPVTLEVPPELAEAFKSVDKEAASLLLRIVAVPARTLRAGAILSPDFMLRNVARDQISAFTFSKNGYIPMWDMMRGAFSMAKKDMEFQDWLKSGGANSAMVSLDRAYLQQHIGALNKDAGLLQRTWNAATTPLEVLRITSELLENATRLGEFKRARGEGKASIQAAGFDSREVTLDFQRIGAQTRGLNMISAFMNAGLEGSDRTVRAFKDNPVGTSTKVAAAITAPSILLWYANNSTPERQERWREIPNWQRDLFWIVMTDEHTYRIPKPFELGVIFGSGAERLLDQFAADKPEALAGFMKSVGKMATINVFPTGSVPIIEQMTKYSWFRDNPLVPSRMEGILPEYQYHEYTTQTSRAVGRLIGSFPGLHDKSIASPIVIDNYIQGWTGGVGTYTRDLLDWSLRKNNLLPDPPQPLNTLADIPVVKAFVVRYPSATAQSVQDFYDKYQERKTVYDTFLYLARSGDAEAAEKEAKLAPQAFARMDGVQDSIRMLNTNIRLVHRNPEMSPSDKRQLIDTMYGQIITLARAGNETMRTIDKVLEGNKKAESKQ